MPTSPIPTKAVQEIVRARWHALDKHGPLKTGADRWRSLISEEYQEVMDELALLEIPNCRASYDVRQAAISELAQLAQLCIGVIELLQAEEATNAAHPKTN